MVLLFVALMLLGNVNQSLAISRYEIDLRMRRACYPGPIDTVGRNPRSVLPQCSDHHHSSRSRRTADSLYSSVSKLYSNQEDGTEQSDLGYHSDEDHSQWSDLGYSKKYDKEMEQKHAQRQAGLDYSKWEGNDIGDQWRDPDLGYSNKENEMKEHWLKQQNSIREDMHRRETQDQKSLKEDSYEVLQDDLEELESEMMPDFVRRSMTKRSGQLPAVNYLQLVVRAAREIRDLIHQIRESHVCIVYLVIV